MTILKKFRITNFEGTTIWKAFILNSFLASLVIVISLYAKSKFDFIFQQKDKKTVYKSELTFFSFLITFIITFCVSLISLTIMYIIFGFGGGMIAGS